MRPPQWVRRFTVGALLLVPPVVGLRLMAWALAHPEERTPGLGATISQLITAQATHHARTGRYAATLGALPRFVPTRGVRLATLQGGDSSFSALLVAPAEGRQCTVRGRVPREGRLPRVELDCRPWHRRPEPLVAG